MPSIMIRSVIIAKLQLGGGAMVSLFRNRE